MEPIENIEQYLRNEFTVEQKKFFEYRMEADADLFKQVELHRKTMRALDNHFLRELKEGMQQLPDEMAINDHEPKVQQNVFNITKLMLAAGLSLVLASIFLWLNQSPTNAELFDSYHETYPNIEHPLARDSDQEMEDALIKYEAGDYSNAYNEFEALSITQPANPSWPFYMGTCALELDKVSTAIDNFEKVIAMDESKYINPSRWFLALAYIKQDQPQSAIPHLQKLIEVDFGYRERAQELSEKL